MNLPNGTLLQGASQQYTIDRTLGQGSFGIAYLAHAQMKGSLGSIDVPLAIKEFFMKEINMRDGSTVTGGSSTRDGLFDRYRQKFRREAQNLSRMKHPGIVKVFESFDANGTTYIVMEYLGGGNLDDYIKRRGRLPEDEALRLTRNIGEALSYMHANHMLHLDLKPKNIMLDAQGQPIIIDFGLSKQYDESGVPESSTTVGGGTPGYAPLEQASYHEGNDFPVTIDVYALGATLFKMLTGSTPPQADIILNEGFPFNDLKSVSQPTIDLIAKSMAFRKGNRYQSVNDFLAALSHPTATSYATQATYNEDTELQVTALKVDRTASPLQQLLKKETPPPANPIQKTTPKPVQKPVQKKCSKSSSEISKKDQSIIRTIKIIAIVVPIIMVLLIVAFLASF